MGWQHRRAADAPLVAGLAKVSAWMAKRCCEAERQMGGSRGFQAAYGRGLVWL